MPNVQVTEHESVVSTLAELIEEASGGRVALAGPGEATGVSIHSLGLDSGEFLAVMSRIEETFSMQWQGDEPPEVFETLDSLARHLISTRGEA